MRKQIFSNPLTALGAGLGLRLFFVLRFPANSGDTVLYEQIATNWLEHHAYAMDVHGAIIPVDLRMPGYPAFLAMIYAFTGLTGESARLWVMLSQIVVDLLGCLLIARLAKLLVGSREDDPRSRCSYCMALWLAALCPFTANYTAVPLTEVFAMLWTTLACGALVIALRRVHNPDFLLKGSHLPRQKSVHYAALAAGCFAGVGALFRPESPILLVAGAAVFAAIYGRERKFQRWFSVTLALGLGCLLLLSPWAVRNRITLGETQFLAPKYSNLPGELVPYGFMAWEKTWLYWVKDCYLVSWKLNEESIDVDAIPSRAFDTAEEKQRVSEILERYNESLTLTPDQDASFGQIARERSARHPLRTYLRIPAGRAAVIWFSPRIELLPISGHVFPLAYMHEEDPLDQAFTLLLFLLNLIYVGLGICGGVRFWRASPEARPVVAFFALFLVLRTIFLTTLETPEPRYVLVCFPMLIALGAQLFGKPIECPPEAKSVTHTG